MSDLPPGWEWADSTQMRVEAHGPAGAVVWQDWHDWWWWRAVGYAGRKRESLAFAMQDCLAAMKKAEVAPGWFDVAGCPWPLYIHTSGVSADHIPKGAADNASDHHH